MTRAERDIVSTSIKLLLNERYIALVGVLNRELVLLDRLIFKLSEAEMLTRAEESRFLGKIVDEIDDVSDDLGTLEVARSMLIGDITAALGLVNDTFTLSELIAFAPDLAVDSLQSLMRRLVDAMAEVDDRSQQGSRAVIEKLDQISRAIDRVQPAARGQDGCNRQPVHDDLAVNSSRLDYRP